MSSYLTLSALHSGMGILLFSLAMLSVVIAVLIAVKPAADQAHSGLMKKANVVGLIELVVAGILTLTGIIAVFMGPWEWSELWLYMGLMVMVFYCVVLVFVTKPARLAVPKGGSAVKTGLQVVLQMGHVLLLFVAFALMVLKPV
jgi:hypothetical protein